MEWSPGCLAALTLGAAVLAALVWIASAALRRHRARRRASLAEALRRRGIEATPDVPIPDGMPDWEIAPRRRRTGTAVEVRIGTGTGFLFDHSQVEDGFLGWNEERSSSGEASTTVTFRHTLLCLHAPGVVAPDLDVIPNVRQLLGQALAVGSATLPEGALGASLLGALGDLTDRIQAARERPGALGLDADPELDAGFRVYGEDERAVRGLLSGGLRDLLLAHPGLIASVRGGWILVTLNVGLAFGREGRSKREPGLLTADQAAGLVELADGLRGILARCSTGPASP